MDDGPPAAKVARKNRWDSAGATAAAAAPPTTMAAEVDMAKELAKAALAKVQLAAAQVAATAAAAAPPQPSLAAQLPGMFPPPKPPTVTLDNQGRLLDHRGKVIQSTPARSQATFKVNQTVRVNPLLQEAAPPDLTQNKYYDPRMALDGQQRDGRKKRTFSFVAEGHFSRKGDDLRAKAAVELMLAEAKPSSKRAAKEGAAAASDLVAPASLSGATIERRLAEVPAAEWWDLPLLRSRAYEGPPGNGLAQNLALEGINHYVEHPVPIAPPAEPPPPPPMPLPLTKKERKKLRTQRRLAAEKEKQDQIRCGLLAPPPAKVKISNLMQAMKDEAVADPSAIEAKVRAEMAQRVKNHEERNAARKLTPQERRDKKKRKLTNDPSGGGTPVSLYRIDQVPSKQKLYKIDMNAQQNHLTGTLLLMDACNLLVVEGGPKAQKRYRKLLMQRIDWNDAPLEDDDEDDDEREAERKAAGAEVCRLVWEGFVVKAQFRSFKVEAARTAENGRKALKERACEHYLDMALRFGTGEGDDDDSESDDDSDDDDDDSDDEAGAPAGARVDGAAQSMDVGA